METEIFLLNLKARLENPVDEFLKFFSHERVEKILRYKFNADRNRTVFAELLAKKLIAERTGKNFTEIKIFRDENGRPYCGESGIFFSLSHSGAWAACSIGDSPNGVDIEIKSRNIDISVAKRFFLANEFEILKNLSGNEREKKFLEYWTLKESCLKCLNLHSWSSVDCEKLLRGEDGVYGKNFYLDDAVTGLCCEKGKMPEKIQISDFENFSC